MTKIPFRGHWCDLAVFAKSPVFEALWPEERAVYDVLAEGWDGSGQAPSRQKLLKRRLDRSMGVAEVLARFERFQLVRFERAIDANGKRQVSCVPGEVALSIMGRYQHGRAGAASPSGTGG
jgi:hypothetical protein